MPPYGVGQVLGEEAVKAMHDHGRVVLVYMAVNSVQSRAVLDGFRQTIAQHKNISLADIKNFKPSETIIGTLAFSQLAEVVNEYSNVDVIVSLLGVKSFTEANMAALPKPCPKLVVMDWNPEDVQRGMNAGLIKAAVMTRRLTAMPSDHPKTAHEWFDRYYDLVTPESGGKSK